MNPRRPLVLLSTLLLAAVLGASGGAAQSPSAAIQGAVLAEDGTGLPGARITLLPEKGPPVVVASGDRGVYRSGAIAPGTYAVRVELPGFETRTVPSLTLGAGETRVLDVPLPLARLREAVTVVGPAPRDSLESARIRESAARDVGEALAQLPGVEKLRKGGIGNDVVVRGLSSRDLNVLVDGDRVYGACPNHMDPPSFHVDFAEVDRVEVAKGPFDVRSQGSLGGVVNVVTKKPESGWHATANVAGGSWGAVNPSLTASWASPTLSVLAGAAYRRSLAYEGGDGRRFTDLTNYAADAREAEAYRAFTGWGKVGFAPAEGHAVELTYARQAADQVFYPTLQMDAITDDTDRFGLSYELRPAGGAVSSVRLQASYAQVDHWMTDQFRTSGTGTPRGWSMGTDAFSRALEGRLEAVVATTTAGVEAYRRYWDTTTSMAGMKYAPQASLPAATADVVGVYASRTFPLGGAFLLDAGARVDRAVASADASKAPTDLWWAYHGTRETRRTDTLPAGHLRLRWNASQGLELTLGSGSTARIPEGEERYLALRRTGSDWVGNPSLDPTRNTGVDLGASWRRSGVVLSANAFASSVDGLVVIYAQQKVNAVPGVMNPRARTYANVDAVMRGVEASASVAATDRVFLAGSLSYVRATQDARPGIGILATDVAEIPPLSGRASARWDDGRFFLEVEGVFAAAQDHVDADLSEAPTPGWGVANLKAGVTLGAVRLVAGVENLFDRLYAEHLSSQRDPFRSGVKVPEPGRTLFANLSYRY